MAPFTLHVRLDAAAADAGDGEALLEDYVAAHDGVQFVSAAVDQPASEGVVVPDESSLAIGGVETFAAIYDDLRQHTAVHDISLWGPDAERFPVPVQHYALQQISEPDRYEYHAIDDAVTLVIAESELEAEQVQRDVPAAAIGYAESPF